MVIKNKKVTKSKKGSMYGGQVKEFFLFTTGIGDWGNSDYTLVHIWNNILLPKVITILIDSGFNRIIINHHDTEGKGIENNNGWKRVNIETYHSDITKMLNYSDDFITSSYDNQPIQFELLASIPHLIFDFAHLFRYKYDSGSPKSIPFIISETNGSKRYYPYINSIYFVYLGDIERLYNIDRDNNKAVTLRNLLNTNFFKINEDNSIQTYIDMISSKRLLDNILDINRVNRSHNFSISQLRLKNGYNNHNRENIFIDYPADTIRMLCEYTYLQNSGINYTRPRNGKIMKIKPITMTKEEYIENVNYFFNDYMKQIME